MQNADKLVGAYIQLRDKTASMEAEFKEQMKPYKQALAQLEEQMLAMLEESGVESIKTAFGTAYKSEKASVTVADRQAFMDYVKANGAFDLLDVRPNKSGVEVFMQEHQDVPPGVNYRRVISCNFRRA